MSKKWIIAVFGFGFLALLAALITAGPRDGAYYREQNAAVSPLLLSDVRMTDYVSLPVFEGMEIKEFTDMEDEEKARSNAYRDLLRTAKKLTKPGSNNTVICDITVSQGKKYIEKLTDYWLSTEEDAAQDVADYLEDHPEETSIHLEHATFENFQDVTLDIAIAGIYAIPYPVSDEYMKQHTEYNSFSAMVRKYIKDKLNESRSSLRQDTMENLIGYAIQKTTFMELPESLCDQEFDVLKKEDGDVQFEDAKRSLKKIFFIAAVLERYSLADEQERLRVVTKYENDNSIELEKYEEERMSFLLFEDDVNNCLYKIVNITETTMDAGTGTEETMAGDPGSVKVGTVNGSTGGNAAFPAQAES